MLGSRVRVSLLVASLSALSICLHCSAARADAQAELEKARAAYAAHSYADAEARFLALLDPNAKEKLAPALTSQARMFLGASYLAEDTEAGKAQAKGVFEKLLIDDPTFDPDPLTFPTKVLNAFIDTKGEMRDRLNEAARYQARVDAEKRARDELEKKRQAERLRIIEQMAAEEKITVRNRRLVATVPFGAGQFQNGQDTAGWIFLGSEAALVIASIVTVPLYMNALDRRNQEVSLGDPDHKVSAYNDRANAIYITNLSIIGALGLVMIGGIVQAHLAFVSEVPETKIRPIPQAKASPWRALGSATSPWFSATPKTETSPGAGFLGLSGTF